MTDKALESPNTSEAGVLSTDSAIDTNDLLRALVAVTGRVAFPEENLRGLVSPTGNTSYLEAYRLCDGRTTMTEIAKKTGIAQPNLHRAAMRWIDAGIAFRVGAKRNLLHLYPPAIPKSKAGIVKGSSEEADLGQLTLVEKS